MLSTQEELERLQNYLRDHTQSVDSKLNLIEDDMNRLVAENDRLIRERESAFVERDICIGLLIQLAIRAGCKAGTSGHLVIVDFPSGQVSWEIAESEAHLFSALPPYTSTIEELGIGEKYQRVMNPGL